MVAEVKTPKGKTSKKEKTPKKAEEEEVQETPEEVKQEEKKVKKDKKDKKDKKKAKKEAKPVKEESEEEEETKEEEAEEEKVDLKRKHDDEEQEENGEEEQEENGQEDEEESEEPPRKVTKTTAGEVLPVVYLSRAPFSVDEAALRAFFDDEIVKIEWVNDEAGTFVGAAIVGFADRAAATRASHKSGAELGGRTVRVDAAKPWVPGTTSIFIGGVHFESSEDDLRNHFESNGITPKAVRMIEGKGIAYLDFEDEEEARAAFESNIRAKGLKSRMLVIDAAGARKEGGDSVGRGRGGRGGDRGGFRGGRGRGGDRGGRGGRGRGRGSF